VRSCRQAVVGSRRRPDGFEGHLWLDTTVSWGTNGHTTVVALLSAEIGMLLNLLGPDAAMKSASAVS
jgi:hypothetical protein